MKARYEYLKLIGEQFLPPAPFPRYQPTGLEDLRTSHPRYRHDLEEAARRLKDYFADEKAPPPLNCLILGPPGAGKTFVAKELAKGLGKKVLFEEHNVSLSGDPKSMLDDLVKHTGEKRIVFIDEFDVTLGGSSVVRFLLDPMTAKGKYHSTAFIFSGSYLKNRQILDRLNSNLADFDFSLFLFDVMARSDNEQERRRLGELYEACCHYQENRQALTPDADLLQYLRQLHKLRDFLSRINGFVVEIPDLASPMMISDHPLTLEQEKDPRNVPYIKLVDAKAAGHVRTFVEGAEKSDGAFSCGFESANEAVLQFKQMLLIERIGLMRVWLNDLLRKHQSAPKVFCISRQDLNYLAMVPLQHNVRSLRFLIEQCMVPEKIDFEKAAKSLGNVPPETRESLQPHQLVLRLDSAALHVAKEPFFESPTRLWAFLKAANPSSDMLMKTLSGEDLIWLSEVPGFVTVVK